MHDFLVDLRGAERVFTAICDIWPQADIFTAIYDEQGTSGRFADRPVHTSFLQRLRPRQRNFRSLLPLYPLAMETLDLSGYDLIVSSSSAWAHGVIAPESAVHVCYCHNPFRYAWSKRESNYTASWGLMQGGLDAVFRRWQRWDRRVAQEVDRYVANSHATRARIAECFQRDAAVIHPPVETFRFVPAQNGEVGDHYLIVSKLMPHKRIDVAVEAFSKLGKRLVIVGDGPDARRLHRIAGPTVEFAGRLSDPQVADLLRSCAALVVPSVEEFGIASVEAQASGRPVVALGQGGTRETVIEGVTGRFYGANDAVALADTVASFDPDAFDPDECVRNAARFDVNRFAEQLSGVVRDTAETRQAGAAASEPRERAPAQRRSPRLRLSSRPSPTDRARRGGDAGTESSENGFTATRKTASNGARSPNVAETDETMRPEQQSGGASRPGSPPVEAEDATLGRSPSMPADTPTRESDTDLSLASHALDSIAARSLPLEEVALPPRATRRDLLGRAALVGADLGAVALALLILAIVGPHVTLNPWSAALLLVFPVLAEIAGLYDRDQNVLNKSTLDEAPALLAVAAIFSLLAYGTRGAWLTGSMEPLLLGACLTVLLVVARGGARFALARLGAPERVLVIGDAATTARVERKLAAEPALNAVVVGYISPDFATQSRGSEIPGGLDELPDVLREHRVERVLVAAAQAGGEDAVEVVRLAKACGVKVAILPRLLEVIGSSVEFDDIGGQALLSVRRFGLTRSARILKRAFDVALTTVILSAFAPLVVIIAIAVKLSSSGPVVFRQTRMGRNGREFEMLKFRTMVQGADERKHELLDRNEAPPLFKIANDPRTTRVGRFLRRHSLDELPQFFNVLRGDMSIVGPRPLVLDEDRLFSGWQRRRYHVAPGITGPWQILGSSRVPLRDMVTLDYLYCANWSLWLDIKILARTVPYVLSRRSGEYEATQRTK